MSEHVDGRLDPEHERLLSEHLAACPDCRRELEALQATVAGLREIPPVEPPADLARSVRARLERPSLPVLAWQVLSLPQTRVAVAAGIALVIGFLSLREMAQRGPEDCARPVPGPGRAPGKPAPAALPMPHTGDEAPAPQPLESAPELKRVGEPARETAPVGGSVDAVREAGRRRAADAAATRPAKAGKRLPEADRHVGTVPQQPKTEGRPGNAVIKGRGRRSFGRGSAEANGRVWGSKAPAPRPEEARKSGTGLSVGPATPVAPLRDAHARSLTPFAAPAGAGAPDSEAGAAPQGMTTPRPFPAMRARAGADRAVVREIAVVSADPAAVRARILAWQRRDKTARAAEEPKLKKETALGAAVTRAETVAERAGVVEIDLPSGDADRLVAELRELGTVSFGVEEQALRDSAARYPARKKQDAAAQQVRVVTLRITIRKARPPSRPAD